MNNSFFPHSPLFSSGQRHFNPKSNTEVVAIRLVSDVQDDERDDTDGIEVMWGEHWKD